MKLQRKEFSLAHYIEVPLSRIVYLVLMQGCLRCY